MNDENKGMPNAGLIGLAVGFAAGALTVILSDPDNRKKVKDRTDEIVDTTLEGSRSTVEKVAAKVRESADKVAQKVKKEIDEAESDIKES